VVFIRKSFNNKKSEAGLVVIIIVIIVVLFLGWLFNVSQRECKSNKDCGSEAYCGSDFSCHQFPAIQKTVVQYNFIIPSIIIGIAIIIATIIFRWNQIKPEDEAKQILEEYKSSEEIKAPEEEPKQVEEEYYKPNIKTS